MKMKKWLAVLMTLAVTTAGLAGCGASDKPAAQQESAGKTEAAETVSGETGSSEQAGGEKVRIKLFTGKIETIDVMDDIIADFNASQDRIEVEQEYQKDASNIIKIKFASGEVPDIMTTYEQGSFRAVGVVGSSFPIHEGSLYGCENRKPVQSMYQYDHGRLFLQ